MKCSLVDLPVLVSDVCRSPHEMRSGMNDEYRALEVIIAHIIISYDERPRAQDTQLALAFLLSAMEGGT
jgi:hypothetical protein